MPTFKGFSSFGKRERGGKKNDKAVLSSNAAVVINDAVIAEAIPDPLTFFFFFLRFLLWSYVVLWRQSRTPSRVACGVGLHRVRAARGRQWAKQQAGRRWCVVRDHVSLPEPLGSGPRRSTATAEQPVSPASSVVDGVPSQGLPYFLGVSNHVVRCCVVAFSHHAKKRRRHFLRWRCFSSDTCDLLFLIAYRLFKNALLPFLRVSAKHKRKKERQTAHTH